MHYRLYKKCPADQENCNVTSDDIQLAPDQLNKGVMPVKYIDANGKEEDPILIMRLSRN